MNDNEAVEVEAEIVVDEIVIEEETDNTVDISDITFDGKDLYDWEEELTVKLPSLPCNGQTITQCLIDLSNKYQIAYNAYNKLLVLASRAENQYKAEKYRLCAKYIEDCKAAKVAKSPAMATVEALVINNPKNKKLGGLLDNHQIYEIIRDFFCNNKTKLEKTMVLAKDISFSVNASDKMHQNAQYVSHAGGGPG